MEYAGSTRGGGEVEEIVVRVIFQETVSSISAPSKGGPILLRTRG
jgi:hypothetical protein